MTSSFPKSEGDFSAFRTATDQGTLAQDRHAATQEGRQVLALEMIADQLGLIASHLSKAQAEPAASDGGSPQLAKVENALAQPEMPGIPDGIERGWIETFAVGGYNYTNLELAIEEAKRARRRTAGSAGPVPK